MIEAALDVANVGIALAAMGLSELVSQSSGDEPSTFILVALWFNLVLMVVFTLHGAWPLVDVLEETCVHPMLIRLGLRQEHDGDEEQQQEAEEEEVWEGVLTHHNYIGP